MDGLISFSFNPEDLRCCFFRYVVRELLACAVIRPVLNLANPRYSSSSSRHLFVSVYWYLYLFIISIAGSSMKGSKPFTFLRPRLRKMQL